MRRKCVITESVTYRSFIQIYYFALKFDTARTQTDFTETLGLFAALFETLWDESIS